MLLHHDDHHPADYYFREETSEGHVVTYRGTVGSDTKLGMHSAVEWMRSSTTTATCCCYQDDGPTAAKPARVCNGSLGGGSVGHSWGPTAMDGPAERPTISPLSLCAMGSSYLSSRLSTTCFTFLYPCCSSSPALRVTYGPAAAPPPTPSRTSTPTNMLSSPT